MTPSVLAASWWCSSTRSKWTWSPSPYLGAWVILIAIMATAIWWQRKGRYQEPKPDPRADAEIAKGSGPYPGSPTSRKIAFVFGLIGLWATLDWPLATLGAAYLATAQMARQVLMVMVVAPLLLYACPTNFAIRMVGWGRGLAALRVVARPFFALPVAAITLLAVNTPVVVDPLVRTPFGAFVLDGMWVVAGFVLWLPVQCPHPAIKRLVGPLALAYLIAQSLVPILPGFWMTWADFPIFSVYELAPRVIEGFDAVNDQNAAAAVLQVGGSIILWLQIAFRFLTWGYSQMEDGRGARPRPSTTRVPVPTETVGASASASAGSGGGAQGAGARRESSGDGPVTETIHGEPAVGS